MNLRATRLLALAAIAVLLCARGLEAQTPVGTAFTYQGRLSDGGTPPTGPYDLQFRLFDASTAGNPATGSDSFPSAPAILSRPGFSVTSMRPSGKKTIPHGFTNPLATVTTSNTTTC